MASPSIIDLDRLLAPISEELPAGDDIRKDSSPTSAYQTIKSARSSARAAERKSVHDGDTQEADQYWRQVLELAPDILATQSKDLEIASWYTEALLRRYGFQGLRDAFQLLHALVENFWDGLHPMPDEDGLETRIAPLSGLNGEGAEGVLIAPIRKVPITEGQPPGPFSYWQYQQALEIEKISDEETRLSKRDKLGFDLEDIERAVNESSDEFFLNQRDDMDQCLEYFRKCSQVLDNHCGIHEAPPTRNILDILEECLGAIKHIGKDKYATLDEPAEDAAAQDEASDAPASDTTPVKSGPQKAIMDRENAFRQLKEISDFFRKTEPHSPISYVLQKAVKWGNMSLDQLVMELIPDSSSRAHFSELTGVEVDE
jgi:type VI secretion system protein ImpA